MRELRQALRAAFRIGGAGAVAVATLALGIGATTTMASVAYATLFRAVPLPDAERLTVIYNTSTTARDGLVRMRWSFPHISELRDTTQTFEHVAAVSAFGATIRQSGAPERLDGEVASPEYFRALQVSASAGRFYTASDIGQAVAIVGEQFWRTRLNSDPAALGTTIAVNDIAMTIVGVMPETVSGVTGRAQVWIPSWLAPQVSYGEYLTSPQHFITAIARIKPNVSLAQANGELAAIGGRFADLPRRADVVWSAAAVPISDARVDPSARRTVTLLFAAAACLLLIACVNVASVFLARSKTRVREMAIRAAIGATRSDLVRQLLLEGFVLAAIAGVAGTMLALWGVRMVSGTSPAFIASWRNDYGAIGAFADASFDWRMLAVALLATLGTTIACSLVPALSASRPRLTSALRQSDRGAAAQGRAMSALVVAEVALAVLLLAGAGVLIDEFARLRRFNSGFETERVLTFWMRPPVARYPPATGPATLEKFLAAVERAPGVESAAVNRCTPYLGCSRSTLTFTDRPNERDRAPGIGRHYISADYFATLGIPLIAGRLLTSSDRTGAQPVTVINETAARRFWPGQNPIGQHVRFGSTTGFTDPAHPVEIVGIVGDVKYEATDQPIGADFYTSYLQFAYPDSMFVVKTRSAPMTVLADIRAAVAAVDPAVPVYDSMMLDERITRELGRPRFNTTIFGIFAGAALTLAALGVYGLLAFAVSSRLREIGVRLALGATPARVLAQYVSHGLRLSIIGVVVGLLSAFLLTHYAKSVVADLGTANAPVLIAVCALMVVVAAAAAFFPARRASAVDPIVVLRNE